MQKLLRRVAFAGFEYVAGRHIRSQHQALIMRMRQPWIERRNANRQRLAALVTYAKTHVPYYRDIMGALRFNPEMILSNPAALRDIPILTKEDILEQGDRLIAEPYRDLVKLHLSRTNGSTGANLWVRYDPVALDISAAVTAMTQDWCGFEQGQRQLHLSSAIPNHGDARASQIERLRQFASNRMVLELGDLNPIALSKLLKKLRAARTQLVQGLPSQLYALAQTAQAEAIDMAGAAPVIVTTGERLHEHQRSLIETVFGSPVINRYGNAEFGVMAHGVSERAKGALSSTGKDLRLIDTHVWADSFSDTTSDTPIPLVITGLNNHAFPLINYATGDLGCLNEDDEGIRLSQLAGRVHDVVRFGAKEVTTQLVQDILSAKAKIDDFQLQVDAHNQVRKVAVASDDPLQHASVKAVLQTSFGNTFSIEFVTYSTFVGRGWQNKFSYVVPFEDEKVQT